MWRETLVVSSHLRGADCTRGMTVQVPLGPCQGGSKPGSGFGWPANKKLGAVWGGKGDFL